MGVRTEFVSQMKTLLNGNFRYGGYDSMPSLPFGNYAREYSDNEFADDVVYFKKGIYTIRLVTQEKDFDLEDQIEDIMDELYIGYQVITDEEIDTEKVHVTEWSVMFCD